MILRVLKLIFVLIAPAELRLAWLVSQRRCASGRHSVKLAGNVPMTAFMGDLRDVFAAFCIEAGLAVELEKGPDNL